MDFIRYIYFQTNFSVLVGSALSSTSKKLRKDLQGHMLILSEFPLWESANGKFKDNPSRGVDSLLYFCLVEVLPKIIYNILT